MGFVAQENLAIWSEEFDHAGYWSPQNASIAHNTGGTTTGPTSAADKLVEDGTNNQHYVLQNITNPGTFSAATTLSVFLKSGTQSWAILQILDNTSGGYGIAWFNLGTGAVGTTGATVGSVSTAVTSLGSGWYRCEVTWTNAIASGHNASVRIYSATADNVSTYTGTNGNSAIEINGAQFERRGSSTSYLATGITAPENLCYYPEEFDNAWWVGTNATVTANAGTTPPSGPTSAADKLIEDSTNGYHYLEQDLGAGASTAVSFSCHLKAGTRSWAYLQVVDSGGTLYATAWFDLSLGALGTVGTDGTGTATAKIDSLGSGWYRCRVTHLNTSASVGRYLRIVATTGDLGGAYAGTNGNAALEIDGAQLERGMDMTTYLYVVTPFIGARDRSVAVFVDSRNGWDDVEPSILARRRLLEVQHQLATVQPITRVLPTSTPTAPWVEWTGYFDTAAGHYTASANVVTQWTDQTGNGRHLAPGSGLTGPLDNLTTTPNGIVALDWNADTTKNLESVVAANKFITTSSWTAYFVMRWDTIAAGASAYSICMANASEWVAVYAHDDGTTKGFLTYNADPTDRFTTPIIKQTLQNWVVLEARFDSGTLYCRINGSAQSSVASGATGNALADTLHIFGGGATRPPDVACACFAVTNTALDLATRNAMLAFLGSKYGIPVLEQSMVYYQDATGAALKARRDVMVANQQALASLYPVPEITDVKTKGWRPRHDDVLAVAQQQRRYFHASRQQDVTKVSPALPAIAEARRIDWQPRYPSIAPSVGRWRWLVTAHQQDVPHLYPRPEITQDATKAWRGHAPDINPWRRWLPVAAMPFVWDSRQPERRLPAFDAEYPDDVKRPGFHASRQLDVTKVHPRPERTLPAFDAEYPDETRRPWFRLGDQLDVCEMPTKPERTQALADTSYPARVDRVVLLPSRQQDTSPVFAAALSAPVPTWFVGAYADRAPAAAALHPRHMAAAAAPVAPERTQALADVSAPERVPRPVYMAPEQQVVPGVPPRPEQALPLDHQPSYPDRAEHPWLRVAAHPTWSTSPQPELIVPGAWAPRFQDRVPRPATPTVAQPYYAANVKAEERVQLDWFASYTDRAPRPAMAAAQPYHALAPQPELTALLAWAPEYPPRPVRAWVHSAAQPYWSTSPQPERVAPLADVVFPARVDRPTLHAAQQQDAPHLWPVPETTNQATYGWRGYAPDAVAGAQRWRWLYPAQQQDAPHLYPRPETTSDATKQWRPREVDRVVARDRWLGVAFQQDVPHLYPVPERTSDATKAWWPAQTPDRARRPSLHPSGHQSHASNILPIVQPIIGWDAVAPASVSRPWHRATDQQVLAPSPAPDGRLPLDHQPAYPDRPTRPTYPYAAQPAYTTSPQPERRAPMAAVDAPVAVLRPAYYPAHQQAALAVPPRPEAAAPLDWWTTAPERIPRPAHPPAEQPYWSMPPAPERIASLADVTYPGAVFRPAFGVDQQIAYAPLPAQAEPLHDAWGPVFPEHADRPRFEPSHQRDFARNLNPEPLPPSHGWLAIYPDAVRRAWTPRACLALIETWFAWIPRGPLLLSTTESLLTYLDDEPLLVVLFAETTERVTVDDAPEEEDDSADLDDIADAVTDLDDEVEFV